MTLFRRIMLSAALLFGATPALAQVTVAPATAPSSILGTFTLASMPTCDVTRQAKYVFITDLGGGPDMVLCDGAGWKHIRLGSPATVTAVSGTVTVTPLASAPIQLVTGSVLTTLNLSISNVGLYDSEMFYFRRSGALTGTIGIALATGGPSIPLLGNSTTVVVYSTACACLVQVQ